MIDQLTEQIKVVAKGRAIFKDMSNAQAEAITRWEEDFPELIKSTAEVKERLSEDEALLRELTLQAYAETGNKHPAVGVNINITTTYTYDPVNALKWAKEHNLALSLDKSAFEKIAKADPPNFVTVDPNVPKATIATNLEEVK